MTGVSTIGVIASGNLTATATGSGSGLNYSLNFAL